MIHNVHNKLILDFKAKLVEHSLIQKLPIWEFLFSIWGARNVVRGHQVRTVCLKNRSLVLFKVQVKRGFFQKLIENRTSVQTVCIKKID